MNSELSDADRYPTLTEEGRRILEFMREHPHAPILRNQSGNRLRPEEVAELRAFKEQVLSARVGWRPGTLPPWLPEFLERCFQTVPFYRKYPLESRRTFHLLPTISRADLGRDVAQFVPDDVPIDRLINFRTSGTTGHPLLLASHPRVAGRYLAYHLRALKRFGIEPRHGRGQVGVILLGYQRKCFTYVSVTPLQDESGLAKVNLHPNDWRDPADRAKWLDAMQAEFYTGDPLSFSELLRLPLTTRPRALLSTSMALTDGLRRRLEQRFECPVLDIYSMNEAGPIAVGDPQRGSHVLLQERLYVEILDPGGEPVRAGERGEITLTGGFNFCMPLVRYRTGDFASLSASVEPPELHGLEGRPPVMFRSATGEWLNNIEVTHTLKPYPLAQYALRQCADGGLEFRFRAAGTVDQAQLRLALGRLFGPTVPLTVEEWRHPPDDKVVQYTSELSWS